MSVFALFCSVTSFSIISSIIAQGLGYPEPSHFLTLSGSFMVSLYFIFETSLKSILDGSTLRVLVEKEKRNETK